MDKDVHVEALLKGDDVGYLRADRLEVARFVDLAAVEGRTGLADLRSLGKGADRRRRQRRKPEPLALLRLALGVLDAGSQRLVDGRDSVAHVFADDADAARAPGEDVL